MSHAIRWTLEKIAQRLLLIEPLAYRRRAPLDPFRYRALGGPLEAPPVAPDVDDADWPRIAPDDYWGAWRQDFVLRTRFRVPASWPAADPVALYLPLGTAGDFSHPEALAYIDGEPFAACDRHHQEIELHPKWRDGKTHSLALHGWVGMLGSAAEAPPHRLLMQACALTQIDPATRDFIAAARVALGIAGQLPQTEPARGRLLAALDAAFNTLDTREPLDEGFYLSLPEAGRALQEGIDQAGGPLAVHLVAAGHAHIDTAWLWTLGQTRRKAERTFYNAIRFMEKFPDYAFSQSQPQLYEFVRCDQPDLFERIRARVHEGRWEPLGGMWVEADCNLSGGESLARQLLLGRTFFREHFGPQAESPVLWLPDVFGYAWNLPQLIRQAGLQYFFTIKIGWNQYNRLPFDSFWWQGLDGTRVLTHFSPTPEPGGTHVSTYNASATPAAVLGTWTNFQQKDLGQGPLLMAYGYGDGGGGPTREMIENLSRLAGFPAAPQVRMGSVASFFRALEAQVGDRLPVWDGELYLELHRGTYTTQARSKRLNRRAEFLLHDAEFLAALAAVLDSDYAYPHDMLRHLWRQVCLNQFHDIIPGSSIGAVYQESLAQYQEIQSAGGEVRTKALQVVAAHTGGDLLIVNPTSFTRRDLAFLPDPLPAWPGLARTDPAPGAPVRTQAVAGGLLLDAGEVPPYSVTVLKAAGAEAEAPRALSVTTGVLENDDVRVELNPDGDITRLFDKRHRREVLPPGALANQFQAFEDRPLHWDAWDVDIFFDDRMWLAGPAESVRVVETGPLRAAVEIRRRILGSPYTQRISLSHNSPRLDFDTTLDWREKHILLKVAFPVEVLSPAATYEVQWGNVQRPTHRNTSWDWARFETCAHKWVDLSEGGYGLSLINDCKYGHDIQGSVIRLSLLRSPTQPDPHADEGEHRFAYSLLPHDGGWGMDTVREAYALNDPLLAWAAPGAGRTGSGPPAWFRVDADHVVIETVKCAEDGEGLIVRLYECQRRRGPVTLQTGFKVKEAWRVNLLEEAGAALQVEDRAVQFFIKPYEIVTLRLKPEGVGPLRGDA